MYFPNEKNPKRVVWCSPIIVQQFAAFGRRLVVRIYLPFGRVLGEKQPSSLYIYEVWRAL